MRLWCGKGCELTIVSDKFAFGEAFGLCVVQFLPEMEHILWFAFAAVTYPMWAKCALHKRLPRGWHSGDAGGGKRRGAVTDAAAF